MNTHHDLGEPEVVLVECVEVAAPLVGEDQHHEAAGDGAGGRGQVSPHQLGLAGDRGRGRLAVTLSVALTEGFDDSSG